MAQGWADVGIAHYPGLPGAFAQVFRSMLTFD